MKEIFSKQNQKIKELKKQKQKNRFLLFLDNQKSIKDAQKFGLCPKVCLVDKEKLANFDLLVKNLENQGVEVIATSAEIIKDFATTQTPQGIVCAFDFLPKAPTLPKGNFLVLDGLQDAGNVGTLLRSALGANFCDVFLVECASLSNPKLVRSTMASMFALNLVEISRADFAKFAKANNLPLIRADMNGESVFDFAPQGQIGLVVGSEGHGVSPELAALCKKTVSIPMANNLESLNAGVAGSIIMFEINGRREL